MLHIVEIAVSDYELRDQKGRMHRWLDRACFQPIGFRFVSRSGVTICRVDFEVESEAKAFSEAFDGCFLSAQIA
jgi:hypothetical protein